MELNENLLPLSGSPSPLFLFAHQNNDQGEFLSKIQICNNFGVSVSSKGKIFIHQMPSFEVICSRAFSNAASCMIQDNDHFIILHTKRPFIYNTAFSVTTGFLKRPSIQNYNKSQIFVSGSYCNNVLVGLTSSNALCLWDVRSEESPHLLTLPNNLNVQDVIINNNVVVIGHGKGFISELDVRNMKQRMNQFDISSQIITSQAKNNQSRSFISQFSLAKNDYEPWIIGFQYDNGPAGIVDLMSRKVIHQIDSPPYLANGDNRFTKPRPIFYKNSFCIAYPGSQIIQVIDYTKFNYGYSYSNNADISISDSDGNSRVLNDYRKDIELNICPVSLASSDDVDGIFAASALGDIYRVF